ncbi:glutamate-5-semialdehyde dehydrogenase [Desulfovibrio litoralis]|uniref:Gamma-glutamyl phosphate reductase n=1 Tax=Desulfovibrio litoralis DSM 11393 TaxID=1121455 RepID=A0A1M7RX68_9BACT|nr:glutamate-5-semialdehyde dehydrogenase [Desulfovibrio litoralis]SHN50776.1 glutamate-5-semialdehyde dehydrogenase [Desulfovibrio litoralis DSM 11393]
MFEENPLEKIGQEAQKASWKLAETNTAQRNQLLEKIADKLNANIEPILSANQKDLQTAKDGGMSPALMDRLLLNTERIKSIIADIKTVIGLNDPIGEIIDSKKLDNGLELMRRRVPLGVIGAIYEARPNVTIDIVSLCLKTANAVILRGGKETINTNLTLVSLIHQALEECKLTKNIVQYIDNPDRKLINSLVRLDKYVSMIIPRGGQKLQEFCQENATIPVITGGIGVCHIFVDKSANQEKAIEIIINAKTQRPSTCNTLETLLVHKDIADPFISNLSHALKRQQVTLHISPEVKQFLPEDGAAFVEVKKEDYSKEWLSLDLNLKLVSNLNEAIDHIRACGTQHSEAILTNDTKQADIFISQVDAAAVYVNASTRFTDGAQFGLGSEIAVSTQKLHARGPMGLEALTSYKWIAYGDYTTRA